MSPRGATTTPATAPAATRPMSAITQRATAFVAEHRPVAEALGRGLAEMSTEPDAFAAALREGLSRLADPEYNEGERRIAPGLGKVFGVRWPLIAAVQRGFRERTRRDRTTSFLSLVARLYQEPEMEHRWFAFGLLERLVIDDPERAWQLLRRAAREAHEWITVDSLAHPYGIGILREPYRWAELEQLVFSPSRWERRLVGSTIATVPFVDRRRGRDPLVASRSLPLIGQLIGDAEPDVQKALAWALRSLTVVDMDAVARFSEEQSERARSTGDGHRAWVIRDALTKLSPAQADAIRERLDGIRRRPGAPSTSEAAETAARFAEGAPAIDLAAFPDPPLT
jgi:3-methyladenine DNA glycosylase AlkD